MIRNFKKGDEKAIALLEKECFSSPWSERAITESYESGTAFLLFEENGVILGYAGMNIILGEGYITNIAVTKSARNKGIGSALISALLKEETELVTLEVRESNLSAISLYTKFGFKNMGKRKSFYESPKEDAIIMTFKKEN